MQNLIQNTTKNYECNEKLVVFVLVDCMFAGGELLCVFGLMKLVGVLLVYVFVICSGHSLIPCAVTVTCTECDVIVSNLV